MRGELIQKRIGRRVVRLARIAQHAGHAGEEDKHIQIAVLSRAMQMPRAQHLRPQHLLESFPTLVPERTVRQHPHAVDYAAQRR